MMVKCIVCGRVVEDDVKEVHHISYPVDDYPEVKAPVHERCHNLIHHTDYFPSLKPRVGHSSIFYDNGKELGEEEEKEPEEPESEEIEINIFDHPKFKQIRSVIESLQPQYKKGVPLTLINKLIESIERDELERRLEKMRRGGRVMVPSTDRFKVV